MLEGGVRSGKTTAMILAFCRAIERLPYDSLNIAFAESIAVARIVLMEGGNGLGIRNYFGEAAHEGQYKGKDALYVKVRNHTHVIVFVGSSQSDSFKSIRGLTISCVIGTEISLSHQTFMEEVIARTLNTKPAYRRLFFDTNPTMAKHYIYTQFIDRWVEEAKLGKLIGGVNYQTCSLYENPALGEEQAKMIASQYDVNSPFYKALILGMRVNSANNVYNLYSYNFLSPEELPKPVRYIIIMDIGISSSATTFICMGKAADERLYIYDAYYHRNGKNSIEGAKQYEDYANDFITFYRKQVATFSAAPRQVYIDQDISMMRILTNKFLQENIPKNSLNYAIKEKISTRITNTSHLLYLGNLIINSELNMVVDGLTNVVYDPKETDKGKLTRLDDTSLDFNPVDICDPVEYGVSHFLLNK